LVKVVDNVGRPWSITVVISTVSKSSRVRGTVSSIYARRVVVLEDCAEVWKIKEQEEYKTHFGPPCSHF